MNDFDGDQTLGPSIGDRLRAAREERSLSLADVAQTTRIPLRHLGHIERSEWDQLPAVTYSIGFARSYANAVGLDGAAIAAEVRDQLGGVPRSAVAPVYYEPTDPSRVPPKSLAVIASLIALLLAIGYVAWRSGAVDGTRVADVQAEGDAPQPAATPAAVESRPAQPAAPQGGAVVLTATAPVWVRVFDGETVLVQRELQAGERYEVPATAQAPQIRLGLPEALQVTVGGRPVPPLGPPATTVRNASLRAADLLAPRSTPAAAAPAR